MSVIEDFTYRGFSIYSVEAWHLDTKYLCVRHRRPIVQLYAFENFVYCIGNNFVGGVRCQGIVEDVVLRIKVAFYQFF